MSMLACMLTSILVLYTKGINCQKTTLEGTNVCIRQEEYNITKKVEEKVPKQVKYYVWCLRLPPRCTRYRTQIETVYTDIVETKTREVARCCEGYTELSGRCVPECSQGCDRGTCDAPGRCVCMSGYAGVNCSDAVVGVIGCPAGRWGWNCEGTCSCSNNSTCHPESGLCLCAPGFRGATCEEPCDVGEFGLGCAQRCACGKEAACHHVTGECSCPPGYTGPLCESSCPRGHYGNNCSLECHCKDGGDCDPVSGTCSCPPGWKGLSCEESCDRGRFGRNCEQLCDCYNAGGCDNVNGSCTCSPGFTGPKCLEKCPPGKFGAGCLSDCDCGGSACDPVTGRCECPPGREGKFCEPIVCPPGFYGLNCTQKCECDCRFRHRFWSYHLYNIDEETPVTTSSYDRKRNKTAGVEGLTDEQVLAFQYVNDGDFTSLSTLCAHGFDSNVADVKHNNETPLHRAAGQGCMSTLLAVMRCGGNVNAIDGDGNTPLHIAVIKGQYHAASVLLYNGADAFLSNKHGKSPYRLAWTSKNRWMKFVFQDHRFQHYRRIRKLLPKEKKLHEDVKKGYYGNVGDVCMSGADPLVGDVDSNENTALHVAALSAQNVVPMVLTLIRCGAYVNARNADGDTPLHLAVTAGHLNATSCLLHNRADVSLRNNGGKTAQELAMQSSDPLMRATFSSSLLRWYLVST